MKVLWFANTPALADERNKNKLISGGWLKSLNKILQNKVDLHISYFSKDRESSFLYKNTHYYPIPTNISLLNKLVSNYKNSIDSKYDIENILKVVKDVSPDIIHIHGTENPFGLIGIKIKTPIVYSMQGIINVYHYKYFSGLPIKLSRKRNGIKNIILNNSYYRIYQKYEKMANRERDILYQAKNILGRTIWDKRVTSILAPNSKYFHSDEILRDIFYEHRWAKKNERELLIHSTTGANYYKGVEDIIKTCIVLRNSGISFTWQVAGLKKNDPLVLIAKKKLHIKELPVELVFLGKLSEENLIKSMLNASMFVLTSHIENSPNSLCEAMLIGMPCISTYVGGTTSLLKDGEEGILVQDGDPWSLAGAIKELHGNITLQEKYSKNAYKTAHKRHDPEQISNNLVDIYRQIITG